MADEENPNFFYGLIVTGAAGFIAWIAYEMVSSIGSLTVPQEGAYLAIGFFVAVTAYTMFY